MLHSLFRGELVVVGIIRPGLGDFPILTEFAVEIAPCGGNGEGTAGGEYVEKWLFFYGVHMHCTRIAIDQGVIAATDVFPNLAIPPFTFVYFAGMGTEFTTDATIFQPRIERG
jgi:hypothetical protein